MNVNLHDTESNVVSHPSLTSTVVYQKRRRSKGWISNYKFNWPLYVDVVIWPRVNRNADSVGKKIMWDLLLTEIEWIGVRWNCDMDKSLHPLNTKDLTHWGQDKMAANFLTTF